MAKTRLKKSKPKKLLMKTVDALWSKIVRNKYDNKCVICGSPKPSAHHIFSRTYKSTRWEPDNGVALCYKHHIWFAHQRFEEFRDFIVNFISEEKYNYLKNKSQEIWKGTLEEEYENLKKHHQEHIP